MPDIDFLSSASASGNDGKQKDDNKKKASQDMQMHVPDALVKKDEFVPEKNHAPKKKEEKEEKSDFLHPHDSGVRVEPPKAKTPPPAPTPKLKLSVPPPPKPASKPLAPPPPAPKPPPPPPKPPITPPPKPPPKKDEKGSTLRVSLLGGAGGSNMTNLTIRAQMKTFLIVVILSLALDGIIYGGILFYKSRVIKNIQKIEAGVGDLNVKISKLEKVVIPAKKFQEISSLAKTLLDNHLHWTQFLAMIEKRALTEVQFLNMNGAESGGVTTDIVARDYTTLAKQILMLESDPQVHNVLISDASAEFADNGLLTGARSAFVIEFDPTILLAGTAIQEEEEKEEVQDEVAPIEIQ